MDLLMGPDITFYQPQAEEFDVLMNFAPYERTGTYTFPPPQKVCDNW